MSFVDPATGRAASLVAITGGTASGKTSLLDAIVAAKERIAPFGAMPTDTAILRPGARSAKIKVTWEFTPAERDRTGTDRDTIITESVYGATLAPAEPDPTAAALLGDASFDPTVSKLEYFAANRRMPLGSGVDATRLGNGPVDRELRLSKDNGKYAALVSFIVAAGLGLDIDDSGKPKPAGRVTVAFSKLCTSKKLAGLYRAGDGVFPGFTDHAGRALGVTQLSDGELDALLVAATFVRNGLRASTILLDTPELHRSDLDTRLFIEGVRAIEEENQIIVATRSPAILGMLPRDSVITLQPS